MNRRQTIRLLAGVVVAGPVPVRSQQQSTMPVVGFLRNTSARDSANLVAAFREGLKQVGYIEGQDLVIEFRWSEGRDDQLPLLASDLIRRSVSVFVAGNLTALIAARAVTSSTPIVFVTGDDPIQLGFVASFNRPADNITGISFYSGTLGAKQLELLHEIVPKAKRIGMLVNPNNPAAEGQVAVAQAAASALGQQLHVANAREASDLDKAFSTFVEQKVAAILIGGDALFNAQRVRLAVLAARYALPAIHFLREYVAAGGLMSYGGSVTDAYRHVGIYTGRLLKGAKPTELPIMLPTKFDMAINLATAKAIGLTVPATLLVAANEVIE